MRVSEVMTKKPVILKKTDSIQKAMELFAKKKIFPNLKFKKKYKKNQKKII